MESFSVHGLSKVFVGKLWERFYWGLILAAVIGFLSLKVHGFYQLYKGKEHRTEIRNIEVFNYTWPEIKICLRDLDDSFCYKTELWTIMKKKDARSQ